MSDLTGWSGSPAVSYAVHRVCTETAGCPAASSRRSPRDLSRLKLREWQVDGRVDGDNSHMQNCTVLVLSLQWWAHVQRCFEGIAGMDQQYLPRR
jgi:hypothetical protein